MFLGGQKEEKKYWGGCISRKDKNETVVELEMNHLPACVIVCFISHNLLELQKRAISKRLKFCLPFLRAGCRDQAPADREAACSAGQGNGSFTAYPFFLLMKMLPLHATEARKRFILIRF